MAADYIVLEADITKNLPATGQRGPLNVWKLRLLNIRDGSEVVCERAKKPPAVLTAGDRLHGFLVEERDGSLPQLKEVARDNRGDSMLSKRVELANHVGRVVGRLEAQVDRLEAEMVELRRRLDWEPDLASPSSYEVWLEEEPGCDPSRETEMERRAEMAETIAEEYEAQESPRAEAQRRRKARTTRLQRARHSLRGSLSRGWRDLRQEVKRNEPAE